MPGFDLWFNNSLTEDTNSGSNSNLFVTGGLFLEPTVSSSFLHFISPNNSSISISSSVSSSSSSKPVVFGILKRKKSVAATNSGFFLSVSLRSDGLVRESKLCLVQNEEKSPEELAIEASDVALEAGEKKRKVRVRGRGAMNTTKHLWAGAIAAMVSRYLWAFFLEFFFVSLMLC